VLSQSWSSVRLRLNLPLTLLVGQAIAFGSLLSLLIITGSALFLPAFGSGALAYVYIVVAILGSAAFYGFGELQRHVRLTSLSIGTIGLVVVYLVLAWLGLVVANLSWVPFALMVSFSLIIQMGFVILGSQAGRLFDVRQVKRQFPRIVAGFVVGFLLGGFIAPRLGRLLGSTEDVLLGAAAFAAIMLVILIATVGRFGSLLQAASQSGRADDDAPTRPLWQLMARRFVLLVVAYQMLSAVVSQLLDFAIFDQAAARFADSVSLAQFFGDYTVWLNLSDLIFLLVLAGLLLSRYGLRLGLMFNPLVDGVILVLEIAAGLLLGVSSLTFFWLVAIARIVDITLTDGTTRGSINTAYQALPAGERAPVQTAVEGIGVPLALGLTGVIIIVFNAIGSLTILHLAIFTLGVTLAWAAVAALTYRDYNRMLTHTLRRRALSPAELTLDDSSSLEVVMALLQRGTLGDIVLGLDMLEAAEAEVLDSELIRLAEQGAPAIQEEALTRIERRQVQQAQSVAAWLAKGAGDGRVRGAALRTYAALAESDALEVVAPYLSDQDPLARQGALVGLLRYGGITGVLAAGGQLSAMVEAQDPAQRRFAAKVIGAVGVRGFYGPLQELAVDPNPDVRRAALEAAEQVRHPRLLPQLLAALDQEATRSTAACVLTAFGEAVLPYARQALSGEDPRLSAHAGRLARLCGRIGGESAMGLLLRFIGHPDDDVRYQVLSALSAGGFQALRVERADVVRQLGAESLYAARLLRARLDLGQEEGLAPLQRALSDETMRTRQRIFFLLSYLYDPRAMLAASQWLEKGQGPDRALAMEMLDVNLTSEHKGLVFPLVDSRLSLEQQATAMARPFAVGPEERDRVLLGMVAGEGDPPFGGWIQTCAVYAAGRLGLHEAVEAVEANLHAPAGELRETAVWALHRLAPDRLRRFAEALALDGNPLVAGLAAGLLAGSADVA
jgi:ATP:ADP antiporter, AAA family